MPRGSDSSRYDGGDYRGADRSGYKGDGNGSASGRGPASYDATGYGRPALDDSAAWFRQAGGYDATGIGTSSRRSARPGYYTPDDDPSGILERIGHGKDKYRAAGPPDPRDPSRTGRRAGGSSGGGRGPHDPVDEPGSPFKRTLLRIWRGSWWRHWSVKKAGLLVGALAAVMALVLVASFFIVLGNTKVPIVALSNPLNQSSLVYFSNGKVVGCFCSADRTVLTPAQIKKSKLLVAAVLAAEDRNFWTEGGVSLTGILRAAKDDLSGNSLQGASTITEQFVKTYYDPTGLGNLTVSEKIKEIFVAIKLAKMRPKLWILTHYLNAIALGAGANGIEAAAETYFHVKAWQLTISQAAMIGAMIQSPYGYEATDPRYMPPGFSNSLLDRWIYVLTNMVRDGAITQQQMNTLVPDPSQPATALKNFPQVHITSPNASWPGYRGYIMQLVANELHAYYGYPADPAKLGNDGLRIHTTINERLMNALYSAVRQNKQLMASYGVPLPSYVHIASVLEEPRTGKIVAFYGGPGYTNNVKRCAKVKCNVNTILTPEPVGSSFKPYVLATAVSQGMNVQTSVMNSHSPLCIPPDYTTTLQLQLSKQTTNCDTELGYWQFNEPSEKLWRQPLRCRSHRLIE